MRRGKTIAVVIPALNEEEAIGRVISAVPPWVDDIVVVDNDSTDGTAAVARAGGARVVVEERRGYGAACLAGIRALGNPDLVVFLDGDFSDHPEEMGRLVDPILEGEAEMVIGSRVLGRREPGALTPQARFGNWLACALMRLFWGIKYTDLGPFRAICRSALQRLGMCDPDYGWTVEMQIKAASQRLRVREVPVSYRRRIGKSKVSGTASGVILAGVKILSTIFLSAMGTRREPPRQVVQERLVVFTRYPEAPSTKTRLIPVLGPKGAADLQRLMTEHILRQAAKLRNCRRVSVEVRYQGGSRRLMRRWLGPGLHYRLQGGGDLGKRMALAFEDAFAEGRERCTIIGSDCPGVTPELLEDAFDQLAQNDLVLGPATDGGYYLIGLTNKVPGAAFSRLFTGIAWGTGDVLTQTLETARGIGLTVAELERLSDVDRPEDLIVWQNVLSKTTGRISVIIPTLNEVDTVAAAIASAASGARMEIVVADGGSDDGTVERASSLGAKMLTSPRGQARQMNKAAALAAGDILLFLHADTLLPRYFDALVRSALARPGVVAGAFEFRVDARRWGLRIIERLVNWRSRRLQMPYGDQAIFMKARTFRAAGGFPEIPIMEDFELVRRLKKMGHIEVVAAPVVTSARRWLSLGVLRTTLINQLTIAAYLLGFSPSLLARWHRGKQ